ncbi:hypothetical protein SUGI_0603550 [Cryptomeria japonica]|nr:hypothetical protein SUGI_0603550 [Cryptomeria japonica]
MLLADVANTGINEDLGQVEYILTNKTGTLTGKTMVFRKCCINSICYGNENGDALEDPELVQAVVNKMPDVVKTLIVMAICNMVVPHRNANGIVGSKSESQGEEALVNTSACLHMILLQKTGNLLHISFNGLILQYEILDILEFISDRKRMSVIIRDC